jgi:DNA-binding PadR family transcriptional regulator
MREQTYLVLLALTDGPLHGYGVISCVRQISDGRVRLGAGTLYGALDRLAGEGLVSVVKEEVVDGRNRRYYDLTGAGQQYRR